ncbi:MAG: hypothetical protein H7Y20_03960 [Bryobacteraceae bacterium]|nr:hypothetical protein [Bryobacteraceae bacterium]
MPERIYKLQPNRTLALRGFDDLGASAALHSATPDKFKVSGNFRDPADFAVLNLHDADNFYEHPRLKYLPDGRFDGLTLNFDVQYSGLMPLDSQKFATIDWPFLDAIKSDGTKVQIRIFDVDPAKTHATVIGTPASAECSFTIQDNGIQGYDRVALWYGNLAFDYIAPPAGGVTAATVAQALAAQINSVNWANTGIMIALRAEVSGATIRIITKTPGADGNTLSMYALWKNENLRTTARTATFSGGSSDSWHVTLDFSALGLTDVRVMWLTFAPTLSAGTAYADSEWEAVFTNWQLTGAEETRRLRIAGPGSVRIEETDAWCTWTGSWAIEKGFYSGGYAKNASGAGCKVKVKYACSSVHDLYVGTALRSDAGIITASLDGGIATTLDCKLAVDAPVNTRRRIRTAVPAGEHSVELVVFSGFRFDFLEAAIPGDLPAPLPTNTRVSPALDYSTDHTFKLPPARIHWIFDQLGFAAPMNEYIGVFWWNQRKRVSAQMPQVTVTFSGTFVDGDSIFLKFGLDAPGVPALTFGKSVFPADTNDTIALHFAQFLNGFSVGVWAQAAGNVLTITSRSPRPAFRFPFAKQIAPVAGSSGAIAVTGSLEDGETGKWMVDPTQNPPLNRGARDWHSDMFRECKVRNREIVVAESMELVNPPDGFGAVHLDNVVVDTDVGFGSLKSTHCNFGAGMRAYQKAVLSSVADLMAAAGITPDIQFGEFLWWFFTNKRDTNPAGGMAFYDAETKTAAQAALGRQLAPFISPTDDPGKNSGADAAFLRTRLHQHITDIMAHIRSTHPSARFEVLYPYDVNHPQPAGIHQLGGPLNRFINLPSEWEKPATAGFDRLKTEALDFGAWSRDLDLSRTTIELPGQLGWPSASVRHLVPIFNPGYPWEKEVAIALSRCSVVNLWAWDHVCLFGLNLTGPDLSRSLLQAT